MALLHKHLKKYKRYKAIIVLHLLTSDSNKPMPQKMKVSNAVEYNSYLVKRGQFFGLIDEIKDKWYFNGVKKQGSPVIYSNELIVVIYTVKYLLKFPLRQIQGFFEDYCKDRPELKIPSYSQICRRLQKLSLKINDYRKDKTSMKDLEIALDSTSINIYHNSGGHEKQNSHNRKYRHYDQTRKMHVAVDINTSMVKSFNYSTTRERDVSSFAALLDKITGKIKRILADRAYDAIKCYERTHKIKAEAIIPPMRSAVAPLKRKREKSYLLSRDKAIRHIKQFRDYDSGIKEWKKLHRYGRRSIVEACFSRFKKIFGFHLVSKLEKSRENELMIKVNILNRFTSIGMAKFVRVS